MSLHLINAQPDALTRFQQCISMLSANDAILLIEDAVYAALPAYSARFTEIPQGVKLYLLQPDAHARGLEEKLNPVFTAIDDAEFVRLCCEHNRVVSW